MSEHQPVRIAWIGAGIMGVPMCGHLLAAGHPVTVFSRRRVTADPLRARGATWADTPAAAAAGADVVFTMVGYPADVRAVVLGSEGVLVGAAPGAVLVDMTTSEPALAVEIATVAAARNLASLDAPVSGGEVGAQNAALTIMVGGDEAAYRRALPLLEVLGTRVSLMVARAPASTPSSPTRSRSPRAWSRCARHLSMRRGPAWSSGRRSRPSRAERRDRGR